MLPIIRKKNTIITKWSYLFLFVILSLISFGQADSCEFSFAFCTTDTYTFPASTNTTAQSGPDYGCLGSQPNPAWYHMKIAVAGDINIKMSSDSLNDIDFVCWGPFDDAYSPCSGELIYDTIVDCSYASWSIENCYIPNGQVGEHYIMLITNYSNQNCNITFEKMAGTGETDCTIVPPPVSNNGPLCVNDTLKLYADSVVNTTYSWTGPDGFISTQQNPIIPNVTVAKNGAFTLVVTTAGSTSDPTYTDVLIREYPIVDFSIDVNDTVCSNELITYSGTDTSGTPIDFWNWTFGDGNIATNQIVQHTYNISGTFTTELIVINDAGCADTASKIITSIANVSSTAGSNQTICYGDNFDFVSSIVLPDTSNCDSLRWIGGTGSFNDQNILLPIYTHGVNDLGPIQIGIIGYGKSPCENDTSYMVLTIDTIPDIGFNVIPNDTVCVNELVSFFGYNTNNTIIQSWQWDFGDGNIANTQNTSNTYLSILNDTVTLIAVNNYSCTDTVSTPIVVVDPNISFSINSNPACFGDTINFVGIGDASFTDWNWNFGDGINGLGQIVSHLYNSSDTFEVTLNVCSKTVVDSAIVYAQSEADAGSSAILCESHPFDFVSATIQPTANNYDSLLWSGGQGFFNNPRILLPVYYPGTDETGTVQLQLVAYGRIPCGNDTSVVTITYNSMPEVGFTMNPNDSICVNEQILFTDTSSTNVINWQWVFDDGNLSSLQNPVHNYTSSGNYNLKLIASTTDGCSDSITQVVTVNPLPEPYFSILPNDTICAQIPLIFNAVDNVGTSVILWSWDFGDGNQSTGQNVTHTYASEGDYFITLSALNNNSCSDFIVKNVHIKSLPESDFTISPNDSTCVDELINLVATDITSDIVQWDWQFGDGNSAFGQNVNHTYTDPTTYTYNILSIYQNALGCIDTTIHQRFVQNVVMDFDIVESPSCQDFQVDLIGTGDLITFAPWSWDFGDGSVMEFGHNSSHVYSDSDTLDIVLNVCSQQEVKEHIIYPTCLVNSGSNEATCENVPFDLTNSSTPPTASGYSSVLWYTNGLGTIIDPTVVAPVYLPDSIEGSIQIDTVYMTMVGYAYSPCENDTSTMMLLVVPGAYAQAGSDEYSCIDEPFDFSSSTDSSFAANYVVLYWLTSGSGHFVDPNVEQPIYIPGPGELGPVTLTMVASNIINCDSIDEMILTIQPKYVTPVDTTICFNDSLFLQGEWQFQSGVFIDTIYSQYGCDSVIITDLTVRPKIDQDFIINTSDSICYGETVGFASTGSANIVSWYWDFGDGNISIELNPIHQYDTAGLFTVGYYYTDDNNCFDFAINQVRVFELPSVSFDINMTNPCINTQIDFAGNSNHNIVLWQWDFGDGNLGFGQYVSHSYTTWGDNVISLTVIDDNGCSEITHQFLNIAEPPTPNFSYNIIVCDSIQFTDLSTCRATYNIISWYWDFGDGNTNTLQNPTHQYAHSFNPGGEIYDVSLLIAADSSGYICTNSINLQVLVPSLPDISVSIVPDPSCFDDSTYFSGMSSHIIDIWNWDLGDSTYSFDQNTSHLYADTGIYYVELSIIDTNGCTVHDNDVVEVKPLPDVSINLNVTYACVNTPVDFEGISNSDIVVWQWDFGDGNIGYGQFISYAYSSKGSKIIELTVTDINGCSETSYEFLDVLQDPEANFTYSSIVCDSLQFTDLSTSAPGYNLVSWDWNFGDGVGISDLQNPTCQFPSNTTPGGEVYYVSLVVLADSSGFVCSDSIVLPVTVPSLPDIFFTYMPDITCLGDSTYFYGESGFPIDVWHWDFDDGNVSNDQYASHLYTLEGDYNVVLTITDTNLCQNTLTNVITVSPVPTVSFSMSDTTACHGSEIQFTSTNSTNVETWYWDFGDGSFSLEDDPIHYFPQGGTYTVTLTVTDSAGCEAEASNQVLILPGATADFTYQNLTCSSVLFNDLSIAPPGYFITNWLWDFGDGFTANVQNPSHSYVTGIGVYDVTLVVTADSSGYSCNDTIVQTIYTPGLPTVFFTWTPEPTMLGNQTDFFGTSGNQITDWYWDFDDGNFATTQDATNTFATVGTFDVELTVTDIDGCQNTILHTVSVTNVPELDYSWNYSCMGEPVQFNVESPPTDIPAVVSWDWDFGDGGISTDMNPLHVYPVAGTYNVSLTIVDTMAATNTIIKQIVVNPLPVALFSIDPLTCAMNDVQFHDLSTTPTGFITQWHWEFGDGNTQTVNFPNDPDVIYQYAAIGTYTVSLTITNSDSCENTTTNDITITASPTAMFSHSEGCESNPFTFTDTSIENGGGIILQWNWDFGDLASGTDNTSTLQNPVHMFSAAGSYDVELMIMNSNGCTDTTTMTITVEEDPEVEFSWTANCQGEETLFEVDETITNVTEVETFAWTFGDGGTSNLQNPTHIYTVAGDYTVTLMITTTAQCMASVTHTVPINPLPTANFDHDAPACLNQEVEFTDLSSSQNGLIETWEWDFGDGNTITITAPDNPDVTHLYTSDGNYDVMLTVTDGEGCINEVTKNVEVVSNPIADFNYDETCYNEPVYFTDMSIENGGPDIQSWEWFFGDPASGTNNNSNLQNPTHVFTAPGVYTTTLIIISTMGCSDTTEQDITIDELPLASIGVADDSICLGQLAEFTGTGTNISTWYWEFGDGGTSIDQNPSYMYQSPGEYIVTLTVTGIGTEQCTFTTDTTITVNGAPEAMFEYENTCLGDSTYFTDLSYSQYGFVSQWDWDFGDGNTSTMEDPSHYYLSNDDYEVTLIVTDNYGCSDTIALWVQVYDSPNPSFTWDQVCDPVGQVNYFDESTPGTDGAPIVGWSWELDDGYFSSEIDPSYIYNIIDTCYTILLTVTDNNGCESTDTNTQVCLHGELEIDFTTTTVCQNQETTFTAIYGPQSDSVASYTWNFNDGSPIEITYYDTIAHIFPQPGMYIVELTAVDTNDCIATIYKEVTVDSLPTAQFTNTIGNCATATEFTDISLGGGEFIENWYWEFGDIASPDNTSTLQNPTHLYGPNDSIYHVKLIVTNFNGCIDSIIQDVYVEPCVVANFELPVGNNCARTELCFTDTSNITSNNNAIDQWRWEFGDGETYNYGDHQNPICHTYEDAGDYDVQLIVVATINGTTYQDTMIRTLTVNPTPLAEIGVTNNCLNDTTRFYDNSTTFGAPILTYEWTFGDETTANDTSSMQDPKYKYPTYGDYITQLIVDNEYGCIDTITDTITVFKLPQAEFSFEELCMSYYTYFRDESIGDSSDIANYNWTFDINQQDTNTSIEPSPVNIYDTAGIYYPRLVIMDENLCKDSIDKVVDIKPIPTSNFMIIDTIQQGNIYLQNLSQDVTGLQDGLTYYWDFDYDYGESSTEVSPTHQYEVDGNYDVMLVSYNEYNCPDTMHQIYNLLFTNLFVPNAFVPSSPIVELQTFKPTGVNLKSYRLEIYSAWGNLVFESLQINNGSPAEGWDGTFNKNDLPTGSYIWRIIAVFTNGEHWKGTDNGDGNMATSGTITLIR